MPRSNSLVNRLQRDYPGLNFVAGDGFRWSPTNSTVYYSSLITDRDLITLLHETAHGVLNHTGYSQDIALLGLERDAWTLAKEKLAPNYGLNIDDEQVETALDSYRDWLEARSACPDCEQTGVQSAENEYACLNCNARWQVNDARQCGLQRRKVSKNKIPR